MPLFQRPSHSRIVRQADVVRDQGIVVDNLVHALDPFAIEVGANAATVALQRAFLARRSAAAAQAVVPGEVGEVALAGGVEIGRDGSNVLLHQFLDGAVHRFVLDALEAQGRSATEKVLGVRDELIAYRVDHLRSELLAVGREAPAEVWILFHQGENSLVARAVASKEPSAGSGALRIRTLAMRESRSFQIAPSRMKWWMLTAEATSIASPAS